MYKRQPELCLSAYSNEDLFFQEALLCEVEEAISRILEETAGLDMIIVAGTPLKVEGGLYNCGVVMHRGRIAGIAVKSYLPNYREFYEARQFRPARELPADVIDLCSQTGIPIGPDLLFRVSSMPGFTLFVEICEDVFSPVPPSSRAALAGATVVANLSASNITAGKDEYRHLLAASQSARCLCAYIYTAAGFGESTTDLAWDGHAIVYENGNLVSLDPDDGSYTLIGPIGAIQGVIPGTPPTSLTIWTPDVDSLAFDPATGILYAVARREDLANNANTLRDLLFQINPATGLRVANAFGAGVDLSLIHI